MIKRVKNSETKMFKVVFPNTLNDHDTLFGGVAMQWMDEVAYITATRFTKMKMVTLSTGEIHFLNAIKSGSIVEIIGNVIKVGELKIEIKVEIFVEEMYLDNKYKAVETTFIFVAIGDNNKVNRMNFEEIQLIK